MPGAFHRLDGVVYCDPQQAAAYVKGGGWIDLTVGDALRAAARRFPDKPAFIDEGRSISFRELDEHTDRLAAALLDLGLRTGDRAIFQMGTSVDTAVTLVAACKAGIIPVCAVPTYREVEIGHLAAQSAAAGYFVQ